MGNILAKVLLWVKRFRVSILKAYQPDSDLFNPFRYSIKVSGWINSMSWPPTCLKFIPFCEPIKINGVSQSYIIYCILQYFFDYCLKKVGFLWMLSNYGPEVRLSIKLRCVALLYGLIIMQLCFFFGPVVFFMATHKAGTWCRRITIGKLPIIFYYINCLWVINIFTLPTNINVATWNEKLNALFIFEHFKLVPSGFVHNQMRRRIWPLPHSIFHNKHDAIYGKYSLLYNPINSTVNSLVTDLCVNRCMFCIRMA